jgi:hypothetical protein
MQPVLHGILHLCERQLDAAGAKLRVQLLHRLRGGGIHVGDGLRRNDHPAHGRVRPFHGVHDALAEHGGVRKEERGVPAKKHEAGDLPGIGVAFDVVVALHAWCAPKDGVMRPPCAAHEVE